MVFFVTLQYYRFKFVTETNSNLITVFILAVHFHYAVLRQQLSTLKISEGKVWVTLGDLEITHASAWRDSRIV